MHLPRLGMAMFSLVCVFLSVIAVPAVSALHNSSEPPVIPVGIDAYRMWDHWAYLHIGQRTYMTSTYDRKGGNEGADASHFLYQLSDDKNVSLDVMGPGVLQFVRTNHWHGSPWHYVVDNKDNIIQETSTADPTHPAENSVFMPEQQFPNPLTWTWSQTKGADLSWVPIPFEKSFTMAYGRTHYGTGYYIYSKFIPDMNNLSKPIKSWSANDVPPADVLKLINESGEDIAPAGAAVAVKQGVVNLQSNEVRTLIILPKAPSVIRALKFSVPLDQADAFSNAWLRIYWDKSTHASVDAPINLLFGAGSIYNRENRQYLVKAFPVSIRFDTASAQFAMYFPMPYMKSAKIELVSKTEKPIRGINWSIRTERYKDPANWAGNFHASYVDHKVPAPGKDLILLDTTQIEGGGDWCGHIIGTSFTFSDKAILNTLEGDPRFYFDDSRTPQVQGTGTEEWGGGGDYWGGRTMTLPFAGHPTGARSEKEAQCPEDMVESAYRFLLADLMPFGRNARVGLEHGGTNTSTEHYRSVTFWYGLHQACLIKTDELNVGDLSSESAHSYKSPIASPVQTVTSRYEQGVDEMDGKEIYPAETDTGRYTKGISTFNVKLTPQNLGVMLRRKLDYSYPNQCARVWVADTRKGASWREVGLWYTAGSNTVIYSNPKGELGATEHNVQTSNRRWRDDEFLLPRSVTQGRSAIRVKIQFIPRNIPLYPGYPVPEQAWSEFRYTAYCYKMPMLK